MARGDTDMAFSKKLCRAKFVLAGLELCNTKPSAMNTAYWIHHFTANTARNDALPLPEGITPLPEETRRVVAASLATFQLGESGGGTRLKRYVLLAGPRHGLPGYAEAVDCFVREEQSHGALLARVVRHLRGELLRKQWTNSVFRWLRNLVNLEFNIQVLLTAELIAEVYFGMLATRCQDPVVQVTARKILADEMKHLQFQREFLHSRLQRLSPLMRGLWRAQFHLIHRVTVIVVAWDHRGCLHAHGLTPGDFRRRADASWGRFMRRLDAALACRAGALREESPVALHGGAAGESGNVH